jgi:hypothetical protein
MAIFPTGYVWTLKTYMEPSKDVVAFVALARWELQFNNPNWENERCQNFNIGVIRVSPIPSDHQWYITSNNGKIV